MKFNVGFNSNIGLCRKHIALCTTTYTPSINIALKDMNAHVKQRNLKAKSGY